MKSPRALLLLGFFLITGPVSAHDFWIEPSTFRLAPGDRVAVRLRVGQSLLGDPVPRDPQRIERFAAIGGLGEARVPGVAGMDPAGWLSPFSPGLLWIVYDSGHDSVQLDSAKFDSYLGDEGLERIRKLRPANTGPVKEIFSRCAKSLLSVGSGPDTGYDKVLGLELELVAEKNPYALKPGEDLPLRLLYKGKPLDGALLVAIPKGAPGAKTSARSDRHGKAALRLDRPGLWLVKAVHMVPAPAGSGADWESLWASLTFELPAH
ncbi:MAG TPA: DUF4198 domain-containing protein [Thermoanaerobaculia bacterium]|jgi:uncharacterized GH25 family protein|nr:DUF4198 domain-containing protein [Thermoanaerobaculia bacterium]